MMRLTVDGVLTSQEFQCFWEKFLQIWKAVPDASEAEEHCMLSRCLPPRERERMVGETNKILGRRRRVMLTGWLAEITATQMRTWLNQVGVQVGKVTLVPGGVEVDPKGEQDTQNLLAYNGKHFQWGNNAGGVGQVS